MKYLVEAADLDEAVEIASIHPAARMGEELGWYVAVRPLFHTGGLLMIETPEVVRTEARPARGGPRHRGGAGRER